MASFNLKEYKDLSCNSRFAGQILCALGPISIDLPFHIHAFPHAIKPAFSSLQSIYLCKFIFITSSCAFISFFETLPSTPISLSACKSNFIQRFPLLPLPSSQAYHFPVFHCPSRFENPTHFSSCRPNRRLVCSSTCTKETKKNAYTNLKPVPSPPRQSSLQPAKRQTKSKPAFTICVRISSVRVVDLQFHTSKRAHENFKPFRFVLIRFSFFFDLQT